MNNNTILAIAFLIAGTLLTTTAVTTMVPAAYAGGDDDDDNGDGNKLKVEDDSAGAIADCDDNELEGPGGPSDFNCIPIAATHTDVDID